MKCSYIITHRGAGKTRSDNLLRVMQWLNLLDVDLELIIVEQDHTKKFTPPSHFKHPLKYEFVINRGLFNKAWAFNIAIGLCDPSSECLIFGDNDVVLNPLHFADTLEHLKTYDAIRPFKRFIDLDIKQTQNFDLSDFSKAPLEGKDKAALDSHLHIHGILCCGLVFYTRRGIQKIGGWDSRFRG